MNASVNQMQLPAEVSNPNLPTLRGYNARIGDDPRVSGFFTAKEALLTYEVGGAVDGLVSAMANRKDGSTETLSEATRSAQPSLDLDGGPKGRPALQFFTSGNDRLTASEAFPVGGDFFKAVVFKPGPTATNEYLMYSGTGGNRHMLQLGINDTALMRVGASGSEAMVSLPFLPDAWNLVVGTWNDTTKTVGLSVNGGDFVFDTELSAAVTDTTNIISNGKLNDVLVSDLLWGAADLSLQENSDLLAEIKAYAGNVLGVIA
ncbi:hypothetical protein [Shimia sp. MIT910701]|uniref:hypothetical protein n=1 Tax=Shimia sp. MIT910701 TaxID=3096987 RepID=UPI0039998C70